MQIIWSQIFVDCSPEPFPLQSATDKGPAQAVQLPHDQRVAGAQEAQRIIEARAGFRAAHLVGEYFFAPSFVQGVELEIEILVVGGDTRIADKHGQSLTKLVSSIRL